MDSTATPPPYTVASMSSTDPGPLLLPTSSGRMWNGGRTGSPDRS